MHTIERHYDRTVTPVDSDVMYIVDNIKSGLLDSELEGFLEDFYQYCEQKNDTFVVGFTTRNRMIDLWDKLVNESDERIHNAVLQYIMDKKPDLVCEFVSRYPSTVEEFLSDDAFARKLWTGYINQCGYDEKGKWIILEHIIQNKIVLEQEKPEFEKVLFKAVSPVFPKDKVDLLKKQTIS